MKNSSLIEILQTFDKEEFRRFEDFVKSPFYNKKSGIIKLLAVIKRSYPDFNENEIKRELVWSRIFPGKPFNYGVMKNLIHGLQKLSEQFIETEIYQCGKHERNRNLIKGLMDKRLDHLFDKNLKAAKKQVEEMYSDPEYFFYRFVFESIEQNYLYQNRKSSDPQFCKPFEMNENLMSSFFASFFSENYNSLLSSRFYNKSYDISFIEKVFNFFEDSLSKNNKLVRLYYYSLKILINNDDEKSYQSLKEDYLTICDKLNKLLGFNIAISLINFCNYKLMKGETHLIDDQFEFCRLIVEKKFHEAHESGYFNGNLYLKFVTSACTAGKFKWARQFMDDYKEKITPDLKQQFYTLAEVNFHIKKRNFNEALEFLSKAEPKEMMQKINIKRYRMMIYYELGYFDELYSFIDASKHFVSNNAKSSESVKESFRNFIALVLQLAALKTNPGRSKNSSEINYLRSRIADAETSNKQWLTEKANELM